MWSSYLNERLWILIYNFIDLNNRFLTRYRGPKFLSPGFAYVGGACVVNKRLEKVNSVAIIEDTGGFSGIIVGAHEVGHL